MAPNRRPEKAKAANTARLKRVTRRDELEFAYKYERLKHIDSLVRYSIGGVVMVGLTVCGYLSIKEMAGKSTDFKSVIDWAGKFSISEGCAWVLAAIFGVGWGRYRHLYKRTMKDRSERVSRLEQLIDPDRTSSKLTKHGDTPPGEPS